jgi:hypothetical protein
MKKTLFVTVTNALCEGIDSANLPAEAPLF